MSRAQAASIFSPFYWALTETLHILMITTASEHVCGKNQPVRVHSPLKAVSLSTFRFLQHNMWNKHLLWRLCVFFHSLQSTWFCCRGCWCGHVFQSVFHTFSCVWLLPADVRAGVCVEFRWRGPVQDIFVGDLCSFWPGGKQWCEQKSLIKYWWKKMFLSHLKVKRKMLIYWII